MKIEFDFHRSDSILKRELNKLHAVDLAEIFEDATSEQKKKLLTVVDFKNLAKMLVELDEDTQIDVFRTLDKPTQSKVLTHLKTDEIRTLLLPAGVLERTQYLHFLKPQQKAQVEQLLTYSETLAASQMTSEFVTVDEGMSIKEATHHVITFSDEKHYIETIFAVDKDGTYLGTIKIKDLIIARPDDNLHDLIVSSGPVVNETMSLERAVKLISDYDIDSIPVLDEANHIIGIITADDTFEALNEILISDYQAFAAVKEHESELSAVERSKKRFPWLLVSVILNILIALFLTLFETTIETIVSLVLFQPMILDMAGNIGTQSLAVTILKINNDDDMKRHIFKEILISLFNAVAIAAVAFGIVFLLNSYVFPSNEVVPLRLATIVSLSLLTAMFFGGNNGVVLPLLLKKMGADEAIASGPLLTSINDFFALAIYFVLATLLLL